MNKNLKVIDIFKIIGMIIVFTMVLTLINVNRIEKTNKMNQSIYEQKEIIDKYVSDNQSSENVKNLLRNIKKYSEDKVKLPEKIPTIEFYGKGNKNKIIMYVKEDQKQLNYYKSEIEKIINTINGSDKFYVTYVAESDYINKIIIEYNT